MNWLGAGVGSLVAALLGALLGALAHVEGRRLGIDFPPVVGVAAGIAAALASSVRSGMRGVLVASLAVWAAALAEVLADPSSGVVEGIARFHERLGLARAASYVGCAVVAALLASRVNPWRRQPAERPPPPEE
ncbi:MAG: hypothetical protein KIS78_13400 [Labilithrix sp.]|nr:hypothetical protein [Labilithrix sp.]MCW5833392.1 hypothetical protein [Labilithrix sp.]